MFNAFFEICGSSYKLEPAFRAVLGFLQEYFQRLTYPSKKDIFYESSKRIAVF
jgi:hypothetical protein